LGGLSKTKLLLLKKQSTANEFSRQAAKERKGLLIYKGTKDKLGDSLRLGETTPFLNRSPQSTISTGLKGVNSPLGGIPRKSHAGGAYR
jgi:hypothetical protein